MSNNLCSSRALSDIGQTQQLICQVTTTLPDDITRGISTNDAFEPH